MWIPSLPCCTTIFLQPFIIIYPWNPVLGVHGITQKLLHHSASRYFFWSQYQGLQGYIYIHSRWSPDFYFWTINGVHPGQPPRSMGIASQIAPQNTTPSPGTTWMIRCLERPGGNRSKKKHIESTIRFKHKSSCKFVPHWKYHIV